MNQCSHSYGAATSGVRMAPSPCTNEVAHACNTDAGSAAGPRPGPPSRACNACREASGRVQSARRQPPSQRVQTPRPCPCAQVWLEGESSAELQAIAMTARHRLERGIWTSPGAGAAACCIKSSVHGGS